MEREIKKCGVFFQMRPNLVSVPAMTSRIFLMDLKLDIFNPRVPISVATATVRPSTTNSYALRHCD